MTMLRVLTQSGVIEGEQVKSFVASPACVSPFWLDIVGPTEVEIGWLGTVFGFHPLTLEDLSGVNYRPKLEEYGDYIFLVVRELIVTPPLPQERQGSRNSPLAPAAQELQATEIHIYLSERYLVTVRDERQCAVDSVWRRVTAKDGAEATFAADITAAKQRLLQPPASGKAKASNGATPSGVAHSGDNDPDLLPPIEPAEVANPDEKAGGPMHNEPLAPVEQGLRTSPAQRGAIAKSLPAKTRLAQPSHSGPMVRHATQLNPYQPQLSAASPFAHGLDFLLYSILDDVVDSYFDALEAVEDEIDRLQDVVVDRPTRDLLNSIFTLKGNLMMLRKQTTPMREAVNTLITHNYSFIRKDNLIYFRDVYSLLVAVYEIVDTERDNAVSVLDAYLSSVNNNLNVVMKRLTGISGLFLPITALTGFAGMNLATLPNAEPWFNTLIYCLLICIPIATFYLFKRNDWL